MDIIKKHLLVANPNIMEIYNNNFFAVALGPTHIRSKVATNVYFHKEPSCMSNHVILPKIVQFFKILFGCYGNHFTKEM